MKRIISILLLLYSACLFGQAKKIYASSVGLTKDSWAASVDNSRKLQYLTNSAPTGSTIVLPNGKYYFSIADTIKKKELRLEGSESTTLCFKQGASAFIFDHNSSAICYVSDLNILCDGLRVGTTGNGIEAHVKVVISNCFIKNFGGCGVSITADVGAHGSDASRSILTNVEVAECGNGFYTQGGDSNGITFYSCSARDCDGYGFNDDSFLGDSFYSCMAHANKLGGYRAMNGNNRTLFMGCYNEGGQPESEIGGVTYVFGGICGFGAGWKAMSPNVRIEQQ